MEGKAITSYIQAAIFYKEFAIQSCISIITNALVLSEFETFEKGKLVKKNNYLVLGNLDYCKNIIDGESS